MAVHPIATRPGTEPTGIDVGALARSLWSQRRLLLLITVLTAVAAAVVLLLRPNTYVGVATLMRNESRGGLGALDFGNATDLAQAVGIELPGGDGSSSYSAVVRSERVMSEVVAMRFYQPKVGATAPLDSLFIAKAGAVAKGRMKAIEWLRKRTSVEKSRRTGVWAVSVAHEHPETASGIVNALVRAAETFQREQRLASAAEQRAFIETQMRATQAALVHAEEALKAFRESNVRINKSPTLLLTEGRLTRDVRMQGEVFLALTKQHELAKIREGWHEPELVVLDRASPPVEKAGPMRTRAVLLAGFAGFCLSIVMGLARTLVPEWRRRAHAFLA